MVILEGLLFTVAIGIISFCFRLAYRGNSGMEDIRAKAERTGRLEKVEKVTRRMIQFWFTILFLVMGEFLIGVFWFVARNGKQGVGMDWFREHGAILLLVIPAVLLLLIFAVRLIIRKKLKEPEEAVPESFKIRCINHPERLNGDMLGIIFMILLGFIPAAMIWSPYTENSTAWVVAIIVFFVIVMLICSAVEESRDLPVLAIISPDGIQPCPGNLIPWESVKNTKVLCKKITLTLKEESLGGKESEITLSLERCHYSDETIQYMISCYFDK